MRVAPASKEPCIMYCAIPENIHTHPDPQKFQGGGGGSKAQCFKEKYNAKLEFLEGWGVQTKNLPWRGMDIFWNKTLLAYGCKKLNSNQNSPH